MPAVTADPVATAKVHLREDLRGRLQAIPEARRPEAAAAAADRLLALPEVQAAGRLLVCLSFGGEIDTWGLVDRLRADGREVCVPRAERGDAPLHVHPYPCALATLSFGLRQPRADCPEIDADDLDAAIVLGLGFDRRGYRLGYGRGHFDRFLAGRRFPAIGLAHQAQLVERLPVAPHDVPMAVVVTDRETVRPAGE